MHRCTQCTGMIYHFFQCQHHTPLPSICEGFPKLVTCRLREMQTNKLLDMLQIVKTRSGRPQKILQSPTAPASQSPTTQGNQQADQATCNSNGLVTVVIYGIVIICVLCVNVWQFVCAVGGWRALLVCGQMCSRNIMSSNSFILYILFFSQDAPADIWISKHSSVDSFA